MRSSSVQYFIGRHKCPNNFTSNLPSFVSFGAANKASRPINAQGMTHTPTIQQVSSNPARLTSCGVCACAQPPTVFFVAGLLRDLANFALWSKPHAFGTLHSGATLPRPTTILYQLLSICVCFSHEQPATPDKFLFVITNTTQIVYFESTP